MGWLSNLFGTGKDPESYVFRLTRARELHGQPVKYVTERRVDNEDVVGRGGHLTLKGEEFLIDTAGDTVFRCPVRQMEAAYLMSGDGVVITGPNLLEEGKIRTLTVHFVYYRK